MSTYKRFSDFAEDVVLDGDKISIDDVLGHDIIVVNYKERVSRYKKKGNDNYTIIQIEHNGVRKVIFTGSNVLHDQLSKYKANLPFVAQIIKNGSYYTFK